MYWFAQAPANIALIKYMGKTDSGTNQPTNPSLSYTLNNLKTSVKLEPIAGKKDYWEPLVTPGSNAIKLSKEAQLRFINHLNLIKHHFNYKGAFLVRSTNNFPHGSGLASSASSFAALTRCAADAICSLLNIDIPDVHELAKLSRQGSGSSCRSFFSPWALWDGDDVNAVDIPYTNLKHQVIVVSHHEKEVSSSLAHERVKSSPLFNQRAERARQNLKVLLESLNQKDWRAAFDICWREFMDMHQLFHTAETPFRYMNEATEQLLSQLQDFWKEHQDGPIVTMDAGPNIHLLYRTDQQDLARAFQVEYLLGNYDVL